MSAKSRLELLRKIEKSAQVTEQTETVTQDATAHDKELAWNMFDELFEQVLAEEIGRINL